MLFLTTNAKLNVPRTADKRSLTMVASNVTARKPSSHPFRCLKDHVQITTTIVSANALRTADKSSATTAASNATAGITSSNRNQWSIDRLTPIVPPSVSPAAWVFLRATAAYIVTAKPTWYMTKTYTFCSETHAN